MMNFLKQRFIKPSKNAYAVVTGAGSGIGRSFALELGKRGGAVVCADVNLKAAEGTVALLNAQGAKGFAVHCDVGDAWQAGRCLGRKIRSVAGAPGNPGRQQRRRWSGGQVR